MSSQYHGNGDEMLSNPWTSGDEQVHLFGLFLETNARLSRDFGSELERTCGLPLASFDVLTQLRRSDLGRLMMNQIAQAIVRSGGGTTRLIDRLEEAALVRREHCSTDRRAVWVTITDEGMAKLDEALEVCLRYLEENLATRLDRTERRTLAEILSKLNTPLESLVPGPAGCASTAGHDQRGNRSQS